MPCDLFYIYYVVFLCFEGNAIKVTISHIKLPPRNVPATFYNSLYVVLKGNHRGNCSVRVAPMTKLSGIGSSPI